MTQSKKKNSRKSSSNRSESSPFVLVGFLSLVILGFYLWGKVQIDFVLRNNDKLAHQKKILEQDIKDLQVQIEALRSYQRIVGLAKKQGLVFVSPTRRGVLSVQTDGSTNPMQKHTSDVKCAGLASLE